MKDLRERLNVYYQMASPTQEENMAAIGTLRDIVETLEEEGIIGLELSLQLGEQARLQGVVGDTEGARMTQRRSMIVRRLCVGADHPSCR